MTEMFRVGRKLSTRTLRRVQQRLTTVTILFAFLSSLLLAIHFVLVPKAWKEWNVMSGHPV